MSSPPLILTPVPLPDIQRGDGGVVDTFVEEYCRITKESLGGSAGTLLKLRPWQHNTSAMVYARRPDGRLRHRQAMIGLPRKNGKSALGSSYGLQGLVMGAPGSEVYSCAADKEQARIVFGVAKRMVELDEQLSKELVCTRDAITYPAKGSVYKVLSSEAFTKEGLNPTTIVYDELHAAPTDELYNVMALAQGSRRDPLMIIITTAGVKSDQTGQDSICYRLYQYGEKVATEEINDPSFFMAWWGAPAGADHRDPRVWEKANPGFNDLIDPEDFQSVLGRVSENTFRTKRLNQWVSSREAWLPAGTWNDCRNDRDFNPGRRGVVLGFDGSRYRDSTALVACTVDSDPQLVVLGVWERPGGDDGLEWQVPKGEVKDRIRQACKDYYVREVACDEWIWQDTLEDLADEGMPVVAFPQTMQRMAPATQRFYEMVVQRKISHNGDKTLARHLDNAQLKRDARGERLIKDKENSPRKIDLAVASVMALDRAAWFLTQPGEEDYVWKDQAGNTHSKPIKDVGFVW